MTAHPVLKAKNILSFLGNFAVIGRLSLANKQKHYQVTAEELERRKVTENFNATTYIHYLKVTENTL